MNIRTKLILSVGILSGMIILLVALSVVNLQILTANEPDSPTRRSSDLPCGCTRFATCLAVDFCYRRCLYSCQHRTACLVAPFHQ